jgi:hypothetical protein
MDDLIYHLSPQEIRSLGGSQWADIKVDVEEKFRIICIKDIIPALENAVLETGYNSNFYRVALKASGGQILDQISFGISRKVSELPFRPVSGVSRPFSSEILEAFLSHLKNFNFLLRQYGPNQVNSSLVELVLNPPERSLTGRFTNTLDKSVSGLNFVDLATANRHNLKPAYLSSRLIELTI